MESGDRSVDFDSLERGLLSDTGAIREEGIDEDETVLCTASFHEMEEEFIKYQTARWVLYSLLFILAWGIGLFMVLYIPVRRYILRKDIRSRKLYLTPNAIVYKVTRPVPFPCFGELKKEKYVLLPLVADIVIEQGYLQSFFGVYSLRIENAGVRRPPSDDVQILGVADPHAFKKAVVAHLSKVRSEVLSRQVSTIEDDISSRRTVQLSPSWMSPRKSPRPNLLSSSGDLILKKLDEVGTSVKRVEALIGEQHYEAS